jgi:hypothetical protein
MTVLLTTREKDEVGWIGRGAGGEVRTIRRRRRVYRW